MQFTHLAAVIVLLKQQIEVLLSAVTSEGWVWCLDGRPLSCPHTHTHTNIYKETLQTCMHTPNKLLYTDSDTHPFSFLQPTRTVRDTDSLEHQCSPPGSTHGDITNRPDQTRQPADKYSPQLNTKCTLVYQSTPPPTPNTHSAHTASVHLQL